MKKNGFINYIKISFNKIQLTDLSLIIFMFILIIQSIFTLFFETKLSNEDNTIDVIIRTSIASIFGYFLSSNFVNNKNTETKKDVQEESSTPKEINQPTSDTEVMTDNSNIIGFLVDKPETESEPKLLSKLSTDNSKELIQSDVTNEVVDLEKVTLPDSSETKINYELPELSFSNLGNKFKINPISQQIIITTIIGLLSLSALLIFRNFVESENAPVATLSQFRDIVSGCIGFLIGTNTQTQDN